MIKEIIKNKYFQYFLQAIAIAALSYLLLNIAFLLDYVFQSLIDGVMRLVIKNNFNHDWLWFPPLKHFLFLLIIFIVSYYFFKTKINVFYKAVFLTLPLAIIYVSLGIFLYNQPIIMYFIAGVVTLSILYYFYIKKKSWLYFYSVTLIATALLIFTLLGGEI